MTALLLRSRRLVVALAVPLGVVLALASATASSAATDDGASQRARNYYGSIAISADAAWGVSYDYATKRKAVDRARSECKKHSDYPGKCVSAVWVRNGCAAVSVHYDSKGFVTRYGWGVHRFKGPAVRAAQHRCGKNCKKLTWVCTTRP